MNVLALLLTIALWSRFPRRTSELWESQALAYFAWLERHFNGGQYGQGALAWVVGVLLPTIAVAVSYRCAHALHTLVGLAFSVLILYSSLRLYTFVSEAEPIARALHHMNLPEARRLFAQWQGEEARRYSLNQIAKRSIECVFLQAHYLLFGPLFWFVALGLLGLGPAPVVFYLLARRAKKAWLDTGSFGGFATQAFRKINWIPAHASALGFAMLGDFEDALYCWRSQSTYWSEEDEGVILTSAAGALGVKLGQEYPHAGVLVERPEIGLGDEADATSIESAIGMVRRVFVLLVCVMFMLSFAYWLGN